MPLRQDNASPPSIRCIELSVGRAAQLLFLTRAQLSAYSTRNPKWGERAVTPIDNPGRKILAGAFEASLGEADYSSLRQSVTDFIDQIADQPLAFRLRAVHTTQCLSALSCEGAENRVHFVGSLVPMRLAEKIVARFGETDDSCCSTNELRDMARFMRDGLRSRNDKKPVRNTGDHPVVWTTNGDGNRHIFALPHVGDVVLGASGKALAYYGGMYAPKEHGGDKSTCHVHLSFFKKGLSIDAKGWPEPYRNGIFGCAAHANYVREMLG